LVEYDSGRLCEGTKCDWKLGNVVAEPSNVNNKAEDYLKALSWMMKRMIDHCTPLKAALENSMKNGK